MDKCELGWDWSRKRVKMAIDTKSSSPACLGLNMHIIKKILDVEIRRNQVQNKPQYNLFKKLQWKATGFSSVMNSCNSDKCISSHETTAGHHSPRRLM